MKKHLLLILFLPFIFSGCASITKLTKTNGKLMGILPMEDDEVVYKANLSASGLNKDQIYRRTRRWFVENFRSSADVIQLQDIQSGELVVKGYTKIRYRNSFGSLVNTYLHQTIAIDIKDGRYRLLIKDLVLDFKPDPKYPASEVPIEFYNMGDKKTILSLFQAVDDKCALVMNSIRAAIGSDRNEEW